MSISSDFLFKTASRWLEIMPISDTCGQHAKLSLFPVQSSVHPCSFLHYCCYTAGFPNHATHATNLRNFRNYARNTMTSSLDSPIARRQRRRRMPLARCQLAVADMREIIEIEFDLHQKLQNKWKRTKIWTIDFFCRFKPEKLHLDRGHSGSDRLELA